MADIAGLRAVIVASDAEPGVFGILRPMLMLPNGVNYKLTSRNLLKK
jgi:hypothetical protein